MLTDLAVRKAVSSFFFGGAAGTYHPRERPAHMLKVVAIAHIDRGDCQPISALAPALPGNQFLAVAW